MASSLSQISKSFSKSSGMGSRFFLALSLIKARISLLGELPLTNLEAVPTLVPDHRDMSCNEGTTPVLPRYLAKVAFWYARSSLVIFVVVVGMVVVVVISQTYKK